ncbi:cupin domain-containing protein [Phyllobacterium salinisoli]|uniref:cupin domain-containing protein n=1 Tax=Phyllobacterium salinisoli TaxID=1899321 RepID=UPI003CCB16B0
MAFALIPLAYSVQAKEMKQHKDVTVTPVLKSDQTITGQPINLPKGDVQVSVSKYEIAPGATLPVHKHLYPRYAYVLEGTLRVSNEDTGKNQVFKAGDFIIESINQWHKGANIGSDPVKLLVIDQVKKGESNVILQK